MKTKTTKTPAVKTEKTATPCLCNCGGTVSTERKGRRFLQGHDARMKGYLQRLFKSDTRDGDPTLAELAKHYERTTGEKLAEHSVTDLTHAINPDWKKFLKAPVAKVKREKKSKSGKLVTRKIGRWQYKGTVDGDTFNYTDSKGKLVTVDLAKTKAA